MVSLVRSLIIVRSVLELLPVEDGPIRVWIVEHGSAARRSGPLIHRPGRRMAISGFEHQAAHAFASRQGLDALDDHGSDAPAAMRGARVHALHFADTAFMASQRPAG